MLTLLGDSDLRFCRGITRRNFLQAGALGALLLYMTLAVGLFGGYAAIRTAAHIAKRKAA